MQPKTRQQIAWYYGYCTRTFTRTLKAHRIMLKARTLISPEAQIRIYAYLGIPSGLPVEERPVVELQVQKYCERHDLDF
jgi:hypothetical protein